MSTRGTSSPSVIARNGYDLSSLNWTLNGGANSLIHLYSSCSASNSLPTTVHSTLAAVVHHAPGALVQRPQRLEVVAQPGAQVLRLADVEHAALRVAESVDARVSRGSPPPSARQRDASPSLSRACAPRLLRRAPRPEHLRQEHGPCGCPGASRDLLRACPSAMICAAAGAALGAQVDDPVGRLDDVEVVLDDDDRVALVDEAVQHLSSLSDVLEVQPGRRLVEHVDGAAVRPPLQLGGELHALRLAAGQGRRALAEPHVAEADVDERLQEAVDRARSARRTPPPPRSACRAPRRCSCPCSARRGCRGCTACRGTPRTRRRRRAGSSSRS